MSDWRDDDYDDEPRAGREPTGEGVRILGSGAGSGPGPGADDPWSAGTWGGGAADTGREAWGEARPSFAAGDDEYDTWSASGEGFGSRPEPSTSMPLPHWTDPPTGDIPRILDDDTSDDLESWSALTGSAPRFRTDAGDWAAGDFEAGELAHDDSTLVGALDESPAVDPHGAPMSRRARREAREAQEQAARGRGRRSRRDHPVDEDLYGPSTTDVAGAAASLGGGSLEGPRPPGHDPERAGRAAHAGAGADTPQRVITGAILAAIALFAFVLPGKVPLLIFATAVVGVAAAEMFEALRRAGYHTATLVGLLGCVAIVPIAYDRGTQAFGMMIFLVVAFTMLWYLVGVMHARPVVNVALTVMVFAYVGCFGAFAGLFLAGPEGKGYILGVVLCVVAYDIVGWFVGSSMGRTPLMPRVSPGKTTEGLFGGMIAAFIMGILVVSLVSGWKQGGLFDGVLLGLVVAVTAPLGDLVESMIKRDLGVKDLGTLLPGHGGIIDRFDALLFTLPATYYVALHIVT